MVESADTKVVTVINGLAVKVHTTIGQKTVSNMLARLEKCIDNVAKNLISPEWKKDLGDSASFEKVASAAQNSLMKVAGVNGMSAIWTLSPCCTFFVLKTIWNI